MFYIVLTCLLKSFLKNWKKTFHLLQEIIKNLKREGKGFMNEPEKLTENVNAYSDYKERENKKLQAIKKVEGFKDKEFANEVKEVLLDGYPPKMINLADMTEEDVKENMRYVFKGNIKY